MRGALRPACFGRGSHDRRSVLTGRAVAATNSTCRLIVVHAHPRGSGPAAYVRERIPSRLAPIRLRGRLELGDHGAALHTSGHSAPHRLTVVSSAMPGGIVILLAVSAQVERRSPEKLRPSLP